MSKKALMALFAFLAAIGLVVTMSGAAQADTISFSWVTVSANTSNGGSTYSGSLEAKVSNHCINMQRKTSTGSWVTSGFYNGGVSTDPLRHCANDPNPSISWTIMNGSAIYGIRAVENTGNIATFCSTKASCQAL